MALSINDLYQFCLNLIRKNNAGGLGSEEFERFWNDEQSSYMGDMLGRFQARNNSKEGVNTGLIENETIMQKLAKFTTPTDLTIVGGNADKPTDFIFRLALRINGETCYQLNHSQIAAVTSSVIDSPSIATDTYYFVEYQDYYYFLPRTLPTATITTTQLDYIKTPPMVKWGYTYDADGRKVYNSGTSVQSEWDDISNLEITKRVLKNIGVSLKDNDLQNFGNSVITTGD